MLDNNDWNIGYLETIAILMCSQISSDPFKNEISDKRIAYISFGGVLVV